MYVIFDNLTASFIGGIVLLLLLTMQQRHQELATEQVMSYMSNRHTVDLGTWMQDDMINIGWNVSSGNGVVSITQDTKYPEITRTFEFDGLDQSDPSTSTRIRYRLEPALLKDGSQAFTRIEGGNIPLWKVQRIIGSSITLESVDFVTFFRIELLDSNGIMTTPSAAEQVRIYVSLAMPYGEDSFLRESHWSTSFFITS